MSASKTLTIRLYRILLHQCRSLRQISPSNDRSLLLQPPIDPREYGRARTFDSSILNYTPAEKETVSDGILSFLHRFLKREERVKPKRLEEEEEDEDECVFVSRRDIEFTIQRSFRCGAGEDISEKQRLAIDAIRILSLEMDMMKLTSVSLDPERMVRVTATSSCIGHTAGGRDTPKHRFAYRIRVENLNSPSGAVVQLLGRSWQIIESEETIAATIHSPTTGVVGYLPVIHPGKTFEYMSGCELATSTGRMMGSFHMAVVPEGTKTSVVGDNVRSFHLGKGCFFDMTVEPFLLVAT